MESPGELGLENILNEIHLFNEEYNTMRQQNTTENQDGDEREGLTLHAGLLENSFTSRPIDHPVYR